MIFIVTLYLLLFEIVYLNSFCERLFLYQDSFVITSPNVCLVVNEDEYTMGISITT